jgi:hypothetical protein
LHLERGRPPPVSPGGIVQWSWEGWGSLEADTEEFHLDFCMHISLHVLYILNICARHVRENGLNVGQYDWDYNQQGMNFLSNGGFAYAT